MRFKSDFGSGEHQGSLLLSKKATQELIDNTRHKGKFSSSALSKLELVQAWQLPQETENLLVNESFCSTNEEDCDNGNTVSEKDSSDTYRAKSPHSTVSEESEDNDTSDDDENSSVSFSDSSPLLVSSLENSCTSSSCSSDDSDNTDMSDEEDNFGELEDEECNKINNNDSSEKIVESSCMSYSSVDSIESFSKTQSLNETTKARMQLASKRHGVVLPDVLPIGITKNRATSEDLELQLRRRDLQLDAAPKLSGECCIVEITTQPDIQVDIRLNPTSKRSFTDTLIKHRSAYGRDPNNFIFFKSSDLGVPETMVKKHMRDSLPSRCVGLGEGVRLNNFTIVNGLKALGLSDTANKVNDGDWSTDKSRHALVDILPIENTIQSCDDTDNNKSERKSFRYSEFSLNCTDNRRYSNKACGKSNAEGEKDVVTAKIIFPGATKNMSAEKNRSERECNVPKELHLDAIGRSGMVAPERNFFCDTNVVPHLNVSPRSLKREKIHKRESNDKSSFPIKTSEAVKTPVDPFRVKTLVPHCNRPSFSNRESEWIKKRQKDREEIRRKLAMDSDNEDFLIDKKNCPKIEHLKDGNNLQICFMNETAKEIDNLTEQQEQSHSEPKSQLMLPKKNSFFTSNLPKCVANQNNNTSPKSSVVKRQRPNFFFNRPRSWHAPKVEVPPHEEDLFTHHRRLQTEAREALAQAKDMARMQMEIERQNKKKSPIAEIVGFPFNPDGPNHLSRQALLDMNLAQLQVIVNDLHSQIETLNDDLVKFLLERDDLHMEQDSMLVDIEDLTRYLGLKENSSISHHTGFKAASATNYPNATTNNKFFKMEKMNAHLKKFKNFS